MKQEIKDKLLALADDLDNKGLPDEANQLREIVSSEEKDNENTEGTQEDGGGTGGNHPPGEPGKP